MSVVEKEDWKNVIDLVSNAKQVVSSVQDVARKLADYANFTSKKDSSGKHTSLKSRDCQMFMFCIFDWVIFMAMVMFHYQLCF